MGSQYQKITGSIINQLSAIVGQENIITDEAAMEDYSRDEMPLLKPYSPQAVVKPADNREIAEVMKLANREKVPVTPRGGGTGLSGGCIPIYGGIVLSLERMNRILEIDEENFVAVTEAGVTLTDLYSHLEEHGLYYPVYPGELAAFIGGTIATNAGGMNAVKYGVTKQNVLGLEVVLPNGDIIKTGGKFVKCATGYDLTQLITGSEGTLAIITQAILKLTTRPPKREVLFAPFTSLQDAIDAVPEILRLPMVPIGLEFMDKGIIDIIEKYLERDMPYHQYEAFLMVTMEGEDEDKILDYFAKVEEICKRHGAVEAMVPGSEHAKRRLFEAREKFYHALHKFAPMEIMDVVVPRSEIAKFLRRVKEISDGYQMTVVPYGHAGDGNVHIHPICVNMDLKEWLNRLPQLMRDVYVTGVSLGGTISGEHGIGFDKKEFLRLGIDDRLLGVMKAIKRTFDPNNILNPGKIFDLDS
ncbi:MAG: FAD-binding oxidoreductase [Dehalococcoidales bacterium]|nr:FAD-binding oxidoreductase [Dehalococcoidales bacterium]